MLIYQGYSINFRTVAGIERLTELEELILDNNDLEDTVKLPQMSKLHTLMLNKNKVYMDG